MKKTKHLLIFVLLLSAIFATNAQIKIFTGGSVTIGATTAPTVNAVMHQINGGKVAFTASTSAVTSAPLINGNNGYSSATAPDFAWLGDLQTGMFHPAAKVVAFTANGVEICRASNAAGQPQIMYTPGSSLSYIPDYSWYGDNNTGIFHYGPDKMGFSTGGNERFRINDNGQLLSLNTTSSAATPDYSWGLNTNTGMFNPSANVLAFSTNGTERARFNSSGRMLLNSTTDDGWLNIASSDYRAASFSVTLSSDWSSPTSIAYVNRANSGNWQVNLSGTTTAYVAGQGWIYSNGTYLGSDINIKQNIKAIDSAMSKVSKINGVTYKKKVEVQNPAVYGTAQEYMGVIAQDVELAAPQVVKNLPDGTKAVCYEMLVGLLVEALKEQNAKITQLQKDVGKCCVKTGTTATQNRTMNNAGKNSGETTGDVYSGNSYIKQNVPNPFDKETNIAYFIEEKSATSSILIFDMNGRLLKTYKLNGDGLGNLNIVGNELQPGMYYYSLVVNNKEVSTKKMILTE